MHCLQEECSRVGFIGRFVGIRLWAFRGGKGGPWLVLGSFVPCDFYVDEAGLRCTVHNVAGRLAI